MTHIEPAHGDADVEEDESEEAHDHSEEGDLESIFRMCPETKLKMKLTDACETRRICSSVALGLKYFWTVDTSEPPPTWIDA